MINGKFGGESSLRAKRIFAFGSLGFFVNWLVAIIVGMFWPGLIHEQIFGFFFICLGMVFGQMIMRLVLGVE
ncbi:MAG: hypothetical protein KDC26_12240 [Armatimonadetes bacterium]|nr:hypothetical protein [Armatimonadota bacterium]